MAEKHIAICTLAELCGEDGNNDDKPRVETTWRIKDGERAGEDYDKWLYLTDAALEWSLKALRAAGFTGDNIADVGQIVGNEARLVMDYEEYKGKDYFRIQFINAITGGKPMEGATKQSFAERMAAKIAAQEAGTDAAAQEDVGF